MVNAPIAPRISRRDFFALLAGCGLGAGLSALSRHLGDSPDDTLSFDLPSAEGLETPTLEIFIALSQIVTVRDALNPESAQRLYPVFLSEPWGPQHILGAYRRLSAFLRDSRSTRVVEELGGRGLFSEGERWFCDHLLTTWYTGVYFHGERETRRLLFEDALMWDSTRDFAPAYFLTSLPYGSWANAPE